MQQPIQQPVYPQPPYNPAFQQQAARKKKKGKGCVIVFLLAIVLVSAFVLYALYTGEDFSFTTARMTNVTTASAVDPVTMAPKTVTSTFQAQSPVIYVTALMKNAPDGTKVGIVWKYLTQPQDIASYEVVTTETEQYVSFNLTKPANGFPLGQYEAQLFIDKKYKQSVQFEVK